MNDDNFNEAIDLQKMLEGDAGLNPAGAKPAPVATIPVAAPLAQAQAQVIQPVTPAVPFGDVSATQPVPSVPVLESLMAKANPVMAEVVQASVAVQEVPVTIPVAAVAVEALTQVSQPVSPAMPAQAPIGQVPNTSELPLPSIAPLGGMGEVIPVSPVQAVPQTMAVVPQAPVMPPALQTQVPMGMAVAPQVGAGAGLARASMETVKFGDSFEAAPLERFKASVHRLSRVSLLSSDGKKVSRHFVKKIGHFHCFGGTCCQREGLPSFHFGFPIVEYLNIDINGCVTGPEYTIKYWLLPKAKYDNLVMLSKRMAIFGVDIVVQCEEEQYQQNRYYPETTAAYWTQDENLKQAVIAEYQQKWSYIDMVLGKTFTEIEYQQAVAKAAADQASAGGFVQQPYQQPAMPQQAQAISPEQLQSFYAQQGK